MSPTGEVTTLHPGHPARPAARPRPAPVSSPSSRPSSSCSSRRSVLVLVGPVVEWDGIRGLHLASCRRCAETFTTTSATQAYGWADAHECDRELAALLAKVCGERAA
ncbi:MULTISPECIES: hypothetical protein [Thermomonospora]|nr:MULTISPECIES: hypothetical protein [Thermomonospora]